MTDRKQNRVRIDAITNAIRKGEYDDKLAVLREAIDDRMARKKQEVLTLVQEVYGEGFVVTAKPQFAHGGMIRGAEPTVVLQSASPRSMVFDDSPPVPDALGDDPEIPQGAANDYESRSPIIGDLDPQ